MVNNIFLFSERVIIWDDLILLQDIFKDSSRNSYWIFFDFQYPTESLKKVKYLVLSMQNEINFKNIYFFNANDFINSILEIPIYLPKNINLFINESCFIGCNYCKNTNQIHRKLSLDQIKLFLWHYHLSDTLNFNIIWQGDPLFNSELIEILEYVKSFWWHTTFFSGWKSLLYCKDVLKLNQLVDEFKINLSSSNAEVYNDMHSLKITIDEFAKLVSILKIFWKKVTLISVLMNKNIHDILPFYKLALVIWVFWIEIKRDVFYPKDYILDNPVLFSHINSLLNKLMLSKKLNILTNFSLHSSFEPSKFHSQSVSLVEKILETNHNIDIPEKITSCHQFGNSLDITERWVVSVCCKYDIWNISTIDYTDSSYMDPFFRKKYKEYQTKVPNECSSCPMPIDRYKNYLKYIFIRDL